MSKLMQYIINWLGARYAAMLLETGQTTAYSVFDDGDQEIGVDKAYTVLAAGAYAGNTNIEVAHYAAATISFTLAGSVVADAANGLVTFLAGDTVVIKGSTLNDGVYTVAVGGVAGQFTTVEALVNEAAGAYVSLYKRAAHSNNVVQDDSTGLMWSRNTSTGEAIGPLPAPNVGILSYFTAANVYTLHPAAADLQMIAASNTLRIVGGAGEVNRYHVGDLLDCAGFANAVNNLPCYYVVSVTVNGADLDIVLNPSNQTLVNEAAAGARSIGLVCRSAFNYMAGARSGSLSGYTDWRLPNASELHSIADYEAPTSYPDVVAFPVWPLQVWTSTITTTALGARMNVRFDRGEIEVQNMLNFIHVALVRG